MWTSKPLIELPQVRAFLALLCWAEGTNAGGRDPYRVVYGYGHTLRDLSDHPAITGEWLGKPLPPEYCRKAGLRPGCKSTAAGAYQINLPTWTDRALRRLYAPSSFAPAEQDAFCWYALCRSLEVPSLVVGGRIDAAIVAASQRWASLPRSSSGQPKHGMAQCLAAYRKALDSMEGGA
jgi:muramidase (phage lysozyme)